MKSTQGLSESSIQHSILDYLNRCPGWFVWRQSSHAVFDPSIRGYRSPGTFEFAGRSDIIGTYKGAIVAIEVKRPGEKLKREQRAFLERIHKLGGIAYALWSIDGAVIMEGEVKNGKHRLVTEERNERACSEVLPMA
jgi:penicillin-binding protein-related factor A (putative recombinase)